MVKPSLITGFIALMLGACQHSATAAPATLADSNPESVEALKAALGTAINRANVELGVGDLTASSSVSVLPPRLSEHETRSPATPTIFYLFIKDGTCLAVRADTDEEIPLPDVPCKPA